MKNFIYHFIKFLIPLIIFMAFYLILSFTILPKAMEKTLGPNTSSQIKTSFKNAVNNKYDMLIIGNSSIYRGINPDLLSIPAYNFSHDNDSYNQIFYKLQWLEEKGKKYKYLVLGIDYFQFSFLSDSRNYAYNEFLDQKYLLDFEVTSNSIVPIESSNIRDIKRLKYLFKYLIGEQSKTFLKPNGQYIFPGIAKPDDKYHYSINRLPVQEKYFEMILGLCNKNNVLVFMVMKPIRENALKNYTTKEIEEFNQYINRNTSSSVFYFNFSNLPGYTYKDYTDITHLNETASDRFTQYLNTAIMGKLK